MITFTTDDLITAIKRLAHVPTAQVTFTDEDFLALADMAMRTHISPLINSAREGYWTTTIDYPTSQSSDVAEYAIPSLALGSSLIDVKLLVANNYLPLDRIEINELTSVNFTPRPNYGYYVEDNLLKLLPNGGIGPGTIRMWYTRMPSQLVLSSTCAQITDIGYDTNQVTVAALPSTFTTATELDIVSANPGFNVTLKDSAPSDITGNVLTFDSVPSRVNIGDWVCLSGQSCVVQCPIEFIEVLTQATVCKVLEAQGYLDKLAAAMKALSQIEQSVLGLVNPRQQQKTKYISAGGGVLGSNMRIFPYVIGKNTSGGGN